MNIDFIYFVKTVRILLRVALFIYAIFWIRSIIISYSKDKKKPFDPSNIDIDYDNNDNEITFDNTDNNNYHTEFVLTTVGKNGRYIQNNNMVIEKQLQVFTPYFDTRQFIDFALDLFERLTNTHSTNGLPMVSSHIDLSPLPRAITCFDGCYLHNYIICDNVEYIRIFCAVITDENKTERYFLTFARENPLVKFIDNSSLYVHCPNCGGDIAMNINLVSECPYCNSTVTFAEYDWQFSRIELINDNTFMCNVPILKNSSIKEFNCEYI